MKEFFGNTKLKSSDLYEFLSSETPDFYQFSSNNSENKAQEKKEDLFYVSLRNRVENIENKVNLMQFLQIKW